MGGTGPILHLALAPSCFFPPRRSCTGTHEGPASAATCSAVRAEPGKCPHGCSACAARLAVHSAGSLALHVRRPPEQNHRLRGAGFGRSARGGPFFAGGRDPGSRLPARLPLALGFPGPPAPRWLPQLAALLFFSGCQGSPRLSPVLTPAGSRASPALPASPSWPAGFEELRLWPTEPSLDQPGGRAAKSSGFDSHPARHLLAMPKAWSWLHRRSKKDRL